MEWKEFQTLAKTEVSYETYYRDIEPAYMAVDVPGMDKQMFVGWWKKAGQFVVAVSNLARKLEAVQKENLELRKMADEANAKIESLATRNDQVAEEIRKLQNDRRQLELSIAFAPRTTTRNIRAELFPVCEQAIREAKESGIVFED